MNGRKLFITDIHGEYTGLIKLLQEVDYEAGVDQLVIGGDMIDRGPDSGLVVRYLRTLQQMYPEHVIVLTGNHEEMLRWYRQNQSNMWLIHGGAEAVESFNYTFADEAESLENLDWLLTLPLVWEDEQYVYTHAGLERNVPLADQSREILWMGESEFYSYPEQELLQLTNGRPVIHGHTPCEFIYFDRGRLNCDMGSHSYAIKEASGLGLIDLSSGSYAVYNISTGKISHRQLPGWGMKDSD